MKHFKETKCYYWDWMPVYERYEDVNVIDYCGECGHEYGSHLESQGINLLRYDLKKFKKDSSYYVTTVMSKLLDSFVIDNVMGAKNQYRH